MIPDSRLACFVQGIDLETITAQNEIDMASELLLLREQKRRLVEDGERLAKEYEDHRWEWDGIRKELYCFACGETKEFHPPDCPAGMIIDQHNALMKEIE